MQHEINLNPSCDKIGHENVIWTLEDIMWWSWENVDKKFFVTYCLEFCTNIHLFHKQINKIQIFRGKCLFTAVSWQGLVRLINSNGAGRSRLSQADPLMDIPCSGITETSVHHVIVEVFYIGQTSSVFCEKRRYYLSGQYMSKHTIPNCQSAIYTGMINVITS